MVDSEGLPVVAPYVWFLAAPQQTRGPQSGEGLRSVAMPERIERAAEAWAEVKAVRSVGESRLPKAEERSPKAEERLPKALQDALRCLPSVSQARAPGGVGLDVGLLYRGLATLPHTPGRT